MVNITAMPIILLFKAQHLTFATSYTPKTKLVPTSYPTTENEFGHTGIGLELFSSKVTHGINVQYICECTVHYSVSCTVVEWLMVSM